MNTEKENYCPKQTATVDSQAAAQSSNLAGTTTKDITTDAAKRLARVQELNDRLRMHGQGGMWLTTPGIAGLEPDTVRSILKAVQTFTDFTPDNDPWGEHDCAVQEVGDTKIIWKIDYYDQSRTFHSPDPANPKVTVRVLTVMLASEY